MSAGHTPGPWMASKADMFGDHNIQSADGVKNDTNHFAIAAVVSNLRGPLEVEANARLIAAAPELLCALEGLERWFDTDQEILDAMSPDGRADHERQFGKIRAAIAKARGDCND